MNNDVEQTHARIDALETQIAFQDQTIEDLNQVVISQADDIRQLKRSMEKLQKQIQGFEEAAGESDDDQIRPPHYLTR